MGGISTGRVSRCNAEGSKFRGSSIVHGSLKIPITRETDWRGCCMGGKGHRSVGEDGNESSRGKVKG